MSSLFANNSCKRTVKHRDNPYGFVLKTGGCGLLRDFCSLEKNGIIKWDSENYKYQRVKNDLLKYEWLKFITVTYPQNMDYKEEDLVSLIKWLKRKKEGNEPGKERNEKFIYFGILEKSSIYHYHLITNTRYLGDGWLEKEWCRITKGPKKMIDAGITLQTVEPGTQEKMVNYILKGLRYTNLEPLWVDRFWLSNCVDIKKHSLELQIELEEASVDISRGRVENLLLKPGINEGLFLFLSELKKAHYEPFKEMWEKKSKLYLSELKKKCVIGSLVKVFEEKFYCEDTKKLFEKISVLLYGNIYGKIEKVVFLERLLTSIFFSHRPPKKKNSFSKEKEEDKNDDIIVVIGGQSYVNQFDFDDMPDVVRQTMYDSALKLFLIYREAVGKSLKFEYDRDEEGNKFESKFKIDLFSSRLASIKSVAKIKGLFPMQVKPKNWETRRQGLFNFTGGYLTNKKEKIYSLQIKGKRGSKMSLEFLKEEELTKAINRLQSNVFTLDWSYIMHVDCVFRPYYLKKIEELKTLYSGIMIRLAEAKRSLKADDKALTKLKAEAAVSYTNYQETMGIYNQLVYELSFLCSFKDYILPGDPIYFPIMVDGRGRFYSATTSLSPTSSLLIRSALRSFGRKQFDFDIYQSLYSKLYLKFFQKDKLIYGKLPSEIARKKLYERIAVKRKKLIEDYTKNPLLFWENQKGPDYSLLKVIMEETILNEIDFSKIERSSYLCELDASSSGSQIYHLLTPIKEMEEVEKYLNLQKVSIEEKSSQDIYSYYGFIFKEFYSLNKQKSYFCLKYYPKLNSKIKKGSSNIFEGQIFWVFLQKIIKEVVMTKYYGLTNQSLGLKLGLYLAREAPELPKEEREFFIQDLKAFLEGLPIFSNTLNILKQLHYIYAKCNEEIRWVTPLGVRITNLYELTEKICVQVGIRNLQKEFKKSSLTLLLVKKGRKDFLKINRSFAPNFVHSLDSSLIGKMLLKLVGHRVTVFTIHDAILCPTGELKEVYTELISSVDEIFDRTSIFKGFVNSMLEHLMKRHPEYIKDIEIAKGEIDIYFSNLDMYSIGVCLIKNKGRYLMFS